MPAVLIAVFYLLLCSPGMLIWWLLHHRIDPHLMAAIPSPRVPLSRVTFDINPTHNDWRGFT